MKKPRSLEGNLVSLAVALGALLVVLVLTLFVVEQALGSKLERLGNSTMPAQQAITGLSRGMARLFERQAQVLSTRTEAELAPLEARAKIEQDLASSRALLGAHLPEIVASGEAEREQARLTERSRAVLESDKALFESVRRRHATEAQFDARTASLKVALEQLIQEARAVAGVAHLDFVLELRRVANGAPPDKILRGNARTQQDSAEQVVTAVLQLGQLVGKIALARNQDELNSIVSNELAQNLARARSHLRVLGATLDAQEATLARAEHMLAQFETLAAQISDAADAQSLVRLRRSVLSEATHATGLRDQILGSVKQLDAQLETVAKIVARETQTATDSARRTLLWARALSLAAFAAALFVGFHAARRLQESVRGLRAQNLELESVSRDLKTMNEGLESLVAERSAALAERERSMRLVLDAMSEALASADRSGAIAGECSKAAVAWFGSASPGTKIWEYLFPADDQAQQMFAIAYEQLAEDLLPFEVSADCMPKRFERDGRVFAIEYRQVRERDEFQRILLVIHDITDRVAAEARERDAREQHQLLANLLRDKQGFKIFVRDAERLILELRSEPPRDRALRALHTLKGNTAVVGMESVAHRCHEIEDALSERDDSISAAEAKALSELWHARLARIEEVLTADTVVELGEADLRELVHGLQQRRDYDELVAMVESWKWTRASVLLRRLGAQSHRVAERLGKTLSIRVEHNGLRVMPGALEDFWSALIHVVRNAVDHGIEPELERAKLGKPAAGGLTLRTAALPKSGFVVELGDDGRGIDFDHLRAVCAARGIRASSSADLIEAMFQDGVTTRDEANDISGRGVGLGAVVAACRSVGGFVEVDSTRGKGTTFRFAFPNQAVQIRDSQSGTFQSGRPMSQRPKAAG